MKQGKDLNELAAEITRQQQSKRDFIADTRNLYMRPEDNALELSIGDNSEAFAVDRHTSTQIATHAGIPQKYYDRMPADLRAVNVNHWLRQEPAQRMVRTLDGNARAFLSDRYRTLDNFDLATAVLPVLQEQPDMQVISCELTDARMYIKALFPRIVGELAVGDEVQSGVVISNSEIGKGSLRVEPLIYRLVCLNGMISNVSKRKYHVGRAQGADADAFELFSDDTRRKTDAAFWAQVQDTVRASVDQSGFDTIIRKFREAKAIETGDPTETVQVLQQQFALTDDERGGILAHLVNGGDLSGFGVVNAVTRFAQDVDDYDRATEFERLGGQILELPREDWARMAA